MASVQLEMIDEGQGEVSVDEQGKQLYRYEDILRAVGRFIDQEGIQDVIILQSSDSVKVHGYRNVSKAGGVNPVLIEHVFTSEDLAKIDEESRERRGTGSQLFR
jgi:hypothetical protein